MKRLSVSVMLVCLVAVARLCGALENGDFETGSLSPWTTNGWFIDSSYPFEGRYCAACTSHQLIQQDFEPVRALFQTVGFWTRQTQQPGSMSVDLLYTDSTRQQVEFSPAGNWGFCRIDSAMSSRKWLSGLRFWGAGDTTFLDGVWMPQRSDIGVVTVTSPAGDSFWVGESLVPSAVIHNYGGLAVGAWVWAHSIHESAPDEYWDSVWVRVLPPGSDEQVRFRAWVPRYAGWYRFSVWMDPLDTGYRRMYIHDTTGIEESNRLGPVQKPAVVPTVGSRFLMKLARRGARGVVIRDALGCPVWYGTGRDAVLTWRGCDRNGAVLPPGVYFVEAGGVRKRIVLAR